MEPNWTREIPIKTPLSPMRSNKRLSYHKKRYQNKKSLLRRWSNAARAAQQEINKKLIESEAPLSSFGQSHLRKRYGWWARKSRLNYSSANRCNDKARNESKQVKTCSKDETQWKRLQTKKRVETVMIRQGMKASKLKHAAKMRPNGNAYRPRKE